jgi:GNAT superfamily N-acetyltransferase
MTGVDLSNAPSSMAKQSPQPVPALLLGRLAVDHRHTGLGVGTALVAHVLATALEINAKAACKAVVVVALHEKARSWWERLGFHPFDPSDPASLDLYLMTNEVGRTLADLEDGPGQ